MPYYPAYKHPRLNTCSDIQFKWYGQWWNQWRNYHAKVYITYTFAVFNQYIFHKFTCLRCDSSLHVHLIWYILRILHTIFRRIKMKVKKMDCEILNHVKKNLPSCFWLFYAYFKKPYMKFKLFLKRPDIPKTYHQIHIVICDHGFTSI